jgi:CBS domain-containing protein
MRIGEVLQAKTSRDVATISPDAGVDELMKLMTDRRIRHVPVVHDGRLVGIISIGDVVKHRIDQLEFERDQLDSYVRGTGG